LFVSDGVLLNFNFMFLYIIVCWKAAMMHPLICCR